MNHEKHRDHGMMIIMNREKRERVLVEVENGIVRELLELRGMVG
jgi:hypothetical protein